MTLADVLQDIHALEQDLQSYERKYGVLSETFHCLPNYPDHCYNRVPR
jgi:hypothetical protein